MRYRDMIRDKIKKISAEIQKKGDEKAPKYFIFFH